MIAANLALLSVLAPAQSPSEVTWWIFLNQGKHPGKATQSQLSEMQQAHLGNFKRLFGMNKLAAAGPVGDPTGFKRGIIVLTLPESEQVMSNFGPDPYVQGGFLDVEAARIRVEFGKLEREEIDPEGIEENRLVYFTAAKALRSSIPTNSLMQGHLESLAAGKSVGLAFFGRTRDHASFDAVALFRGKDDKGIDAWIAENPYVKAGIWRAHRIPQWISKGVLGGVKPW